MMNETQAVIAVGGGTVVINAVGWIFTIVKSSRNKGFYDGTMKEKVENIDHKLNQLPCISDKNYREKMGGLFATVEGNSDRLVRIENKIDKANGNK